MNRFIPFALGLVIAAAACTPEPTPAIAPSTLPTVLPTVQVTASPEPTQTAVPERLPSPAPTVVAEVRPIKIGLLTDQSGGLALYGSMLERGFALGLEYATDGTNAVAGRPIQVILKDTASKLDVGSQAVRDLIEKEKVDLLVGAPNVGVTLGAADIAKQNKKILIAQPAASVDLTGKSFNPYVFRTSRTTDQEAIAAGVALGKLGKTFLQIAPDNVLGYSSTGMFYSVVKAANGKFAVNDSPGQAGAIFAPADTKDFGPYLQKVLDAKADVLIVTWAGAGFSTLYTQMQQNGVFKVMQVYSGMADNQSLMSGYSFAFGASGVMPYHFSLPKNDVNDWLVQKHKDKFKQPPDIFTEGGFTAAQMLVAGLKATNGDADADKLVPVLEKTSFNGPKGKYTVRDYDHILLQTMYVVKLKNTDDPDWKFFDLVYELKPEETAPPCRLEGEYKTRCKSPNIR